jgi:outer membrane protein assembly factor BamB
MKWQVIPLFLTLFLAAFAAIEPTAKSWMQWAQNSQHTGFIHVKGQSPNRKLAVIRYDPFVAQEKHDEGGLLAVHYQAPLVAGNSVYMEFKTGEWIPCHPFTAWLLGKACGPNTWDKEIWNEKRLDWKDGKLAEKWTFTTDWKPVPNGYPTAILGIEPVFHPVLGQHYLYVPGFGGTVWKVDKSNGKAISQINPFGSSIDALKFVAGPLTIDAQGNLYYNVIKFAEGNELWVKDTKGAWLVKIAADDSVASATFEAIIPGAPKATDNCPSSFYKEKTLPWPPSTKAKPPSFPCGSQRPPLNIAPAVAPDGTIYTISRTQFVSQVSYLVAINPDLTPKWQASLGHRLHDGCGVIIPIATHDRQSNACREGATQGVDPNTNESGSAWLVDYFSSSPTVLPDGSILFAGITLYGAGEAHTMKFSSSGRFVAAYPYGSDLTPSVYTHDGTYSILLKQNNYSGGLYCQFPHNIYCQPLQAGPYYIARVNAALKPEWTYKNPTVDQQHPNGYEWCVNAEAIDADGNVYSNSEDGSLYVLNPDGSLKQKIFLQEALEAAYTPISLGPDGKIYAQNNGVLFVLGN